ncbi:MAG: D-alanine--D-alanine ligase [Eubacterium sp.]|uniref:D-alanine--D-alanine ligase family protein n=1 Tax=Eubacterium sp. TaxID=142586 RepID=UPI003994D30A
MFYIRFNMNIVVLCGGNSTEREVSINSGYNVCGALREKGHNAILLDAFFGNKDLSIFEKSEKEYDVIAERDHIRSLSSKVKEEEKSRKSFFGENVLGICAKADIVFLALHGKNGEDGKCQATLDLHGIKYTGSGALASAIGMDKAVTKQIFIAKGVPTAKSVWIKKGEDTSLEAYGMKAPVVVKACNGGSSVGVVLVKEASEYDSAVEECFKYDNQILVEDFIEGREFSIGVVDGMAYPIVEIIPNEGWYDYENKYKEGATTHVCPAKLDEELTKKMQKVAEGACAAIGCEAYSRADVMMDKDGNMFCLEVNTLPGMTATSLIPDEARAIGIDYPTLCDNLINISLKKYQ